MAFFSKLINSFRSTRLNEKKPVSGYLFEHLLVGSMYAEQQSAYLNSYETGLDKSDIRKLSGWNYGRSVFLGRCCYELGYLTKNELKDYLVRKINGRLIIKGVIEREIGTYNKKVQPLL